MKPRVVYSIGVKFGGGGIGTPAYYGALGLFREGMLQRVLCGAHVPTEIPDDLVRAWGWPSRVLRRLDLYDPIHGMRYLHDVLYDIWAAHHLEPADIFHVWNSFGLRSLRRAHARGMTTVVQRAASHPRWRLRLLREEYARWGRTFRPGLLNVYRSLAELAMGDYILVPSRYAQKTFEAHGFPAERLLWLPFGVNTRRFRPPANRPSRPFRVLYVGTVTIGKGVPYLLQAWAMLGWRDAELWIVGRMARDMKPIIARYRTLPGLRLWGHRADVVPFYQQAHVFAFPSLDEGSALVTYEAMACGLPVITTPHAGAALTDGLEGVIVPIRDPQALAQALEALREDPQRRAEMGRRAREKACQLTWERHQAALVRLYGQLTGTPA